MLAVFLGGAERPAYFIQLALADDRVLDIGIRLRPVHRARSRLRTGRRAMTGHVIELHSQWFA